jgi:1H-pyrrole-2-carbonyl-[peptidyl-carrier protein] chlorinase
MADQFDFDIGIIGGGPAGSTIAAYLVKAGLKVGVFERDMFPRPHVGESLVPASNPVLQETGAWEEVAKAGFSKKTGAAWSASTSGAGLGAEQPNGRGRMLAYIPFEGNASTFHVDRGKFDTILLKHAKNLGAEVFTGTRVTRVDFADPDRPVIYVAMGRQEIPIRVRMVVDASGRSTLLGHQMKMKQNDPHFDQFAIHTWFSGYKRTTFVDDRSFDNYIFIHFLPISHSWIWQIPITEDITSIGVVTPRSHFRGRQDEREAFFWEFASAFPELAQNLRTAERIRPLTVESDYSYSMQEIRGDGFLMIGDAARFVDPIFSSGVSVALNTARLASKAILAAAEAGDFRRPRFDEFEGTVRRGLKHWYEFITLYYKLNIYFSTFLQDPRYREDVFQLIQGNVYDETDKPVLEIMRRTVNEVESNPDHPWRANLNKLSAMATQS